MPNAVYAPLLETNGEKVYNKHQVFKLMEVHSNPINGLNKKPDADISRFQEKKQKFLPIYACLIFIILYGCLAAKIISNQLEINALDANIKKSEIAVQKLNILPKESVNYSFIEAKAVDNEYNSGMGASALITMPVEEELNSREYKKKAKSHISNRASVLRKRKNFRSSSEYTQQEISIEESKLSPEMKKAIDAYIERKISVIQQEDKNAYSKYNKNLYAEYKTAIKALASTNADIDKSDLPPELKEILGSYVSNVHPENPLEQIKNTLGFTTNLYGLINNKLAAVNDYITSPNYGKPDYNPEL